MDRKEIWQWAAWPVVVVAALLAAWYFLPEQRAARLCDEQIKAKLVAPSTYDRLDASAFEASGGYSVRVEYEAKNALGVPIRGFDRCLVSL